MTPQRVTLITLGVADLDRSTAFYAALGWTPKEHLPEVRFHQMNGLVLGLFGIDDLAKDQGRPDAKLGVGAMLLRKTSRPKQRSTRPTRLQFSPEQER
ncbi:MAG: catechol 2,3-dioxygenase-like lactoylglutathione lyase family enzyme [Gammaproteobacteria bacterium]|jgi:catechol 2,3-dioxygenase-like lactoylglutathione lyase family enzyme